MYSAKVQSEQRKSEPKPKPSVLAGTAAAELMAREARLFAFATAQSVDVPVFLRAACRIGAADE